MNDSPSPARQTIRLLRFMRVDPREPVPLSAQLEQQITWLMASGELQEGDKLPAIRDLAKHLGINMHTVRAAYQALAADGLVASRRGLGTVVLGYDPWRVAKRTPGLPSFTIGVLIPSLNPFYTPFIRALEDTARDLPWMLLICHFHDSPELARRLVHQLGAKQVDGLILTSTRSVLEEGRGAKAREPRGLPPLVHVDEPDAPGHVVLLDSEGAGYRATTHLLQHGHRRIGLITGPVAWPNLRQVYLGYQRAVTSAGLDMDSDLVIEVPAFSMEWGYRAAQRLLDKAAPPSAIFGAADVLAIGAMQAIKARGKTIPDDVAVVGYNDIELAALVDPALTTVSAPAYEMGVQAMTTLQQLHSGHPVKPERIVLDTELVIRRSCGCGGTPGVSQEV
jgi:DNA-binding LacI/PurR family transcriptional regulator